MTGPRLDEQELQRLWAEYQASKQPAQQPTKPTRATFGGYSMLGPAVRQAAQGATFGFADEIEAGIRAPFSDRSYRDIRDEIRSENEAFQGDHQGLSLAANVAGGAVTGTAAVKAATALPKVGAVLRAVGILPKVTETATLAQRLGAGVKAGTAAGVLGGAGAAAEMKDIPKSAAVGGAIGGAAGLTMGGVFEAVRAGRNIVGGLGQGAKPSGPIRQLVQAEDPEQAGARRVLSTMGRAGQSVDDLAAASATAPKESSVAELIPRNQGQRALRIARNVGRERDAIDASLTERAAEEPANWYKALAKHTGMDAPRDPKAYADEAKKAVKQEVAKLSRLAGKQPDVKAPDVARVVAELHEMGEGAILDRAGKIAIGRNALNATDAPTETVSVKQLQYLRRAMDRRIDVLKSGETPDMEMVDLLGQRRKVVDRVLKQAGGKAQRKADRLWKSASERGESFGQGGRVEQAGTDDAVQRMTKEARDPEAFRQGAASKQMERAANVNDGEVSNPRNPVVNAMGSTTRRARTRAGFSDDASFEAARGDAKQIAERLKFRQGVSGNSTTAANQQEIADEFMANPGDFVRAAVDPTSLPRLLAEKVFRGGVSGMNAGQATQMGKVLSGGLPGQMSRDDAIEVLRKYSPAIYRQLQRQLATRSAVGGVAARQSMEPSR